MVAQSHVDIGIEVRTIVSGRSILIVDDDDALVDTLAELLRQEGCVVEAHTDVICALQRLQEGLRPDVILLDYLMPGMTGCEFLEQLEQDGIDVPVMLFTAMNASRVNVPMRNVRAVIHKPFELDRLLEELARIENG